MLINIKYKTKVGRKVIGINCSVAHPSGHTPSYTCTNCPQSVTLWMKKSVEQMLFSKQLFETNKKDRPKTEEDN